MNQNFIVAFAEHRILGIIAIPYIITKDTAESFYRIMERVTLANIKNYQDQLSEEEIRIVQTIEEYSDTSLVKVFSKKKASPAKFYQTINKQLIEQRIIPYIENRIVKCIDLIIQSGTSVYFKDHQSNLYEDDRITINKEPASTIFNFERAEHHLKYFLTIKHENHEINLIGKEFFILSDNPCRLILDKSLLAFNDIDAKKLLPFFKKEFVAIPKSKEKEYFQKFILHAVENYHVNAKGFEIITPETQKQPVLSLENNLRYEPVLSLKFRYNEHTIMPSNKRGVLAVLFQQRDNYQIHRIERDKKWETQCFQFIKENGLITNDKINFQLPYGNHLQNLISWLNEHEKKLVDYGYIIEQQQLDKKFFTKKIDLKIQVNEQTDWFDLHILVRFGEYEIPFTKLRSHIVHGIREYELPGGEIAILPEEWFARYKDIFLFGKDSKEGLKINKFHFSLLQKNIKGIDSKYISGLKNLADKDFSKPVAIPAKNRAQLRPYQEEGYSWMYHMYEHNFGACLSDDMGLGKTLQALTLLSRIHEDSLAGGIGNKAPRSFSGQLELFSQPENQQKPFLIIMPTSLIHNWKNEIKKFAPHLSCLKYTGINREDLLPRIYDFDIMLTSYGIVRNDIESLKKVTFRYVILDESQAVKNPESKTYRAVLQLQAELRLVLTGTPIENSLSDLWSQLNFINRGLLGSLHFFKQEFITPIERYNDEIKEKKLKNLIQPFILRRTKKEVEKDLPDLSEQLLYCDMSESQTSYYETEKSRIRNALMQDIRAKGLEKSAVVILQALTRLRQIANHPALIDPDYSKESGKFDEIIRNIENLTFENHKILVFSSFVKYLELFKAWLHARGWQYALLTGGTKNREAVIKQFQEDDNTNIFLISLKAGGVGLNLTAADYVFILDPWWNPAAENQAVSRAHRIGQSKKVFAYKFIAKDTIEEKIIQLQEKKSALADAFVNTNNPFRNLTTDEVMALFE